MDIDDISKELRALEADIDHAMATFLRRTKLADHQVSITWMQGKYAPVDSPSSTRPTPYMTWARVTV